MIVLFLFLPFYCAARGLDPRAHPSAGAIEPDPTMDARVKPAQDAVKETPADAAIITA